ncbi:uncharacterized protein LOC122074819 isoform X2 [Macadamia integrifolia]|uniref:uncharacterized protein LOC122074819 isoform X2 n=1 Tax=Macadamia integrifolia TaxID=60698 RepID=UPI001C4F592B|nr:uncharacterized protein LOC122074819 isoform X2 [Macadamia integrifolia]
MVWSHPDISLEDLLNLIKGFVDILIMASGYQSSGLPAVWDAQNMRKAMQWGLFFEDGIANLSSANLSKAREFVLQHLFHALPLRDAHLSTLMTAAVEMDLNDLKEREYDCLNVYLDKLKLENTSLNLVTEMKVSVNNSMISHHNDHSPCHAQALCGSVCNPCAAEDSVDPGSPLIVSSPKLNGCHSADYSKQIIQEILKRQTAVSCISSIEMGLNLLSESLLCGKCVGSDCTRLDKRLNCDTSQLDESLLVEFVAWSRWRSKNLSYLLDKKTIRMVSGANLIFSAPKVQWLQVFERLQISAENRDNVLLEITELSLLGCIANRWNCLVEHLMSVSYFPPTISKQYHEVHNLLHGGSRLLHPKGEIEENGIIDHLTGLLGGQLHHLWKLSPILPAAAVPSWSTLLKLYLNEIEAQLKGNSSLIRCCSCIQDGKEHKECELAERIWCLYIIHIRGSLPMNSISST